MRTRGSTVVLLGAVITACGADPTLPPTVEEDRVRYVALGDSYTIGTSVATAERWPNQLAAEVEELELIANLGVNGYTSADLIRDELPQLERLGPELVTVLIGVNDVVQGVAAEEYEGNVVVILEELLGRLPPSRIVCVATPDYTRTPQGAAYGDPGRQAERIEAFNGVLADACRRRGIAFVGEPFRISRAAGEEPGLVAGDGLHPSGEQYRRWVEAIRPVVEDLLAQPPSVPAR